MSDTEEIVDDLESIAPCGIIHSCYVRHHRVFGSSVVLEKRYDGDNASRRDVDGELILPYRELLDEFGHA